MGTKITFLFGPKAHDLRSKADGLARVAGYRDMARTYAEAGQLVLSEACTIAAEDLADEVLIIHGDEAAPDVRGILRNLAPPKQPEPPKGWREKNPHGTGRRARRAAAAADRRRAKRARKTAS